MLTLFKKDSKGKLLIWQCYAYGTNVVTTHGQVGGKLQTKSYQAEPTNVGRANARTAEEQAEFEAQAAFEKQQKAKGYVLTEEAAMGGESSDLVEGGVLPMLAFDINKTKEGPEIGDFVQPKLDGHRCIAVQEHDGWSLWSRTRKRITSMVHIEQALKESFPVFKGLVLDGELYNHELKADFERLTSAIRKQEPTEEAKIIEYHVYDVVNGKKQDDRLCDLDLLFDEVHPDSKVKMVQTFVVAHTNSVACYEQQFVAAGYEGIMLRKRDGLYEHKRSRGLLKIKRFADEEFLVVGSELSTLETSKGPLTSLVVVCETKDGKRFGATAKGDKSRHAELAKGCEGKQATVKFFGYTADGIPRFGVFKGFRED
jgi:ATP-dependent DNA ligase